MRGPQFQQVHELLDSVVDDARGFADLVTERIVALGAPLDARTRTVGQQTSVPELPTGFLSVEDAIAGEVAALDATIVTVRAAVYALGEVDPMSEDVAGEVARGLDKDRWFLASHLETA